ncbi:hypothetical protein [Bartonella sp. MR168JLCBS]|uniref:hypothetical protein n=1 Tax=Bartonella sp. MR168JLCBS TaxID=3243556 RepID=UPI0035CE9D42
MSNEIKLLQHKGGKKSDGSYGTLRITKDELILSHGENQIHLSEKGLVLSHQSTRVELTGSVHIQAEDLQHNQKSVGASHKHGGVKMGPSTTSYPL